jgi:hypothetical protein
MTQSKMEFPAAGPIGGRESSRWRTRCSSGEATCCRDCRPVPALPAATSWSGCGARPSRCWGPPRRWRWDWSRLPPTRAGRSFRWAPFPPTRPTAVRSARGWRWRATAPMSLPPAVPAVPRPPGEAAGGSQRAIPVFPRRARSRPSSRLQARLHRPRAAKSPPRRRSRRPPGRRRQRSLLASRLRRYPSPRPRPHPRHRPRPPRPRHRWIRRRSPRAPLAKATPMAGRSRLPLPPRSRRRRPSQPRPPRRRLLRPSPPSQVARPSPSLRFPRELPLTGPAAARAMPTGTTSSAG